MVRDTGLKLQAWRITGWLLIGPVLISALLSPGMTSAQQRQPPDPSQSRPSQNSNAGSVNTKTSSPAAPQRGDPSRDVSLTDDTRSDTSAIITSDSGAAPAGTEADGRYRIGPGDVLNVQVFNRPQLSREAVRVDGRGMIRMPWIDEEIRAACHTEAEVAAEITSRYRHLLRAPQVGVFIKEYQSQPVAVVGAVNQPGRFQLQRSVRLLELLTFAGGPAERAGRTVQIIHSAPTPFCEQPDNSTSTLAKTEAASTSEAKPQTTLAASSRQEANVVERPDESGANFTSLNLAEVMHGNPQANPFVRPGDIVSLPDAQQVFVVGNVLKPATLTLREPITVSQAIAMAGGLMPDTRTDRIRIVRQTPDGKNEIYVDLKAIDKRRAEDIQLQANDIVDVPTASGKRFLRTILGAVAPSVGQLPVRVIP